MLKDSDDFYILGVTFDSRMTFEKHLRSVSIATFQRLGILKKSWRVFHDKSLLGTCFLGFVLPVLEYWTGRSVSGVSDLTGVCLSATLLIVGVWQYRVCCKISGVTRYNIYLRRMCQCRLHAVLWSHIGIIIRLLAGKTCSMTGVLFPLIVPVERTSWPCIRWCGTGTSRPGTMRFYWHELLYPFLSSPIFHLLFFLSIGWHYRDGVFELIGCRSLSPALHQRRFIYRGA